MSRRGSERGERTYMGLIFFAAAFFKWTAFANVKQSIFVSFNVEHSLQHGVVDIKKARACFIGEIMLKSANFIVVIEVIKGV